MRKLEERVNLLTAKDVAAYLKLHEQHVYKLARRGEIPCVQIGRARRFRREAIEEWVQQQEAA